LTPAELDELQHQIGVELPADCQQFLLNVDRGGAGPFYGIIPVRRVDGPWQWRGDTQQLRYCPVT
jgi:hypothetical protein